MDYDFLPFSLFTNDVNPLSNSIRPFGPKCARYRTPAIDITGRDRYSKNKGIEINTLWFFEIDGGFSVISRSEFISNTIAFQCGS